MSVPGLSGGRGLSCDPPAPEGRPTAVSPGAVGVLEHVFTWLRAVYFSIDGQGFILIKQGLKNFGELFKRGYETDFSESWLSMHLNLIRHSLPPPPLNLLHQQDTGNDLLCCLQLGNKG